MRSFSSNVQTILNSDNLEFFFLVDLYFNNTYRFTSYSTDLTVASNTYISDGGLFEVDSPDFSSVLDREAYRIVISDLSNNFLAEIRSNVVGKAVEVRAGFIQADGTPNTTTSDLVYIYRGTVDRPTINNDFGEKRVVIEGTSPLSDLDAVNSFMTSKAGMDNVSSTDTSFDEVFDNNEIELRWGKL
jgi:hypothetical protein